jgi:hypothetical protein
VINATLASTIEGVVQYQNSGLVAGMVSADNVAFNGFGKPATITALPPGATFSVLSLHVTPVWYPSLNVTFTPVNARGVPGEPLSITAMDSAPKQLVDLAMLQRFRCITQLTIDTTSSIRPLSLLGSAQVAIDDLVVQFP